MKQLERRAGVPGVLIITTPEAGGANRQVKGLGHARVVGVFAGESGHDFAEKTWSGWNLLKASKFFLRFRAFQFA